MPWISSGSRDEIAHRHPRIERGEGVLEDHLHVPAKLLGAFSVEPGHVLAVEDEVAGVGHEAGDRLRRRRLAAAGFADEREGFAAADHEGDALHGVDAAVDPAEKAAVQIEAHGEPVGDQQRVADARRRVQPAIR